MRRQIRQALRPISMDGEIAWSWMGLEPDLGSCSEIDDLATNVVGPFLDGAGLYQASGLIQGLEIVTRVVNIKRR